MAYLGYVHIYLYNSSNFVTGLTEIKDQINYWIQSIQENTKEMKGLISTWPEITTPVLKQAQKMYVTPLQELPQNRRNQNKVQPFS